MRTAALATLVVLVNAVAAASQGSPDPVVIDGRFSDWRKVPVSAGSALPLADTTALGRLWVTHDQRSLYLRFETGHEISLQTGNDLRLCLDTDGDHHNGAVVNGMAADFCWFFGRRRGIMADMSDSLEHQHVGLISAPTVTSRTFELSLELAATPFGQPLFSSDTIRIVVSDGPANHLPVRPGGLSYVLTPAPPSRYQARELPRFRPEHLRVVSYNLNDHLTEPHRLPALGRVIRAVDPDVILLQEIRSTATEDAKEMLRQMLPDETRPWQAAKIGGESSVILSPYPIVRADSLGESGAVLLEVAPGQPLAQLLIVILSAPCCGEHEWRDREIASIMSYLEDAKTPGGRLDLVPGTPILMMGDANLVGPSRQLRTLLYGGDPGGEATLPDWDGTAFTDLRPMHSHAPQAYTWYGEEFPPGRLDYVIYSDAALEVANNYVLDTRDMPDDQLESHGLRRGDTMEVSDHLPLIADLIIP